jgi:hypothetical protein
MSVCTDVEPKNLIGRVSWLNATAVTSKYVLSAVRWITTVSSIVPTITLSGTTFGDLEPPAEAQARQINNGPTRNVGLTGR